MDKTNSNSSHKCPICENPGNEVCSSCMSVAYCSVEHQKLDWKTHCKVCKIYTVQSNEQYGRYMVAAKDISPSTVIMNEPVLAYGPKPNARPLCLGCHRLLLTWAKEQKPAYNCSKCLFPMCGRDCEQLPIHADNECKIFQKYNLPFPKITNYDVHHPIYECILPLRCLLLKSTNPKKWKKLTAMMHHNEIRSQILDLWYRNHVNIVRFLLDHCQMKKEFHELDIHTVLGYIDVNAFEVIINGNDIAGLFHNTYIMSHECVSNTHHTFTADIRMVVRATIPIKQGQQITSIYANILEGTLERLQYLKDSKYFDCTCRRCADPSEMSTFTSAIKCQGLKCAPGGYLLPIQPLDLNSNWRCSHCSSEIPIESVQKIIEPIKDVLKKREKNFTHKEIVKKLESILRKYENILHPNHYLLIQVVYTLVGIYCGNQQKFKLEEMKRTEELSMRFLNVLDVISPGMSRLRGVTMFELQSAIYAQAEKDFENGNIGDLKARLCRVAQLLEESLRILSFDAVHTKEGKIVSEIPNKLAKVKEMIEKVSVSSI